MIKVIAFDYAGVVIPGPMTQWVKNNLQENDEKWKKYNENARKWDLGEMSLDQVYKVLSDITEIPADQIWEKFYVKAGLNKNVLRLIKRLRKNYKIILFSNFISEPLRRLLKHHEIEKYFDELIISSEHKMRKPDPKFFELLVERANALKGQILFIDDRIVNIDKAQKYGIKTILFENAKTLESKLKSLGLSF